MRYVLQVPLKPPSKNDLRPDLHVTLVGRRLVPTAWLRYQGMHRKWEKALRDPFPCERARGRRRLTFYRYMGPREKSMDEWNLSGGLNLVVVDILVAKGWLLDDRRAAVQMTPPLEVRVPAGGRPSTPCTLIVLEDLEERLGSVGLRNPPA